MIIRSLRFSSVGQPFKGKEVYMDFSYLPAGVYAFVGGNGEGKTTVLELLKPGVLYRRFPSYRESFQQKATSRQAFAEEVFDAGGFTHKVVVQADPKAGGGRGKTEAYWYTKAPEVDDQRDSVGEWTPNAGPLLADVDRYRDKFFPSIELLLAGPFCAQKVTRGNGSFFAADPADRKNLFVEALGLGRLQELSEEYGKRAAAQQQKIVGMDGELAGLRNVDAKALQALRDRAEEQRDEWMHSLEAVEYEADTTRRAFDTLKAAHASYGKEQARLLLASRQHREEVQALGIEAAALDAESVRLQGLVAKRTSTPTQTALLAAKRAVDRAEIAEKLNGEASGAARKLALEIQGSFDKTREARDRAAVRLKALEPLAAALNGVNLELEICRVCPLTQQAQPAVDEVKSLRDELVFIQAAVVDMEPYTAAAHANSAEAEGLLIEARRATTNARQEAAAIEHLRASIPADLDEQVKAFQARVLAHDARAQQRKTALEALPMGEAPPPLAPAEAAAAQAQTALKQARTRLEQAQAALVDIETRLRLATEAEARAAGIRAQRGELVDEVAALELLAAGLGKSGLQAVYIDQAGPIVETLTNRLLHETFGPRFSIAFETRRLKKGKKVTDPDAYTEVFDLRIIDAWAGIDEVRAQGSGGETVWFDTAFRLALSIYVTQSTGKDLRTLCFDEPSGGLSEEFAPKFTAMLQAARAIGRFHHVFLVSHQRDVWGAADGFFAFRDGAVSYCNDVEQVDAILTGEV